MKINQMLKKAILISISVIFLLAATAGVWWIVKKEVEKSKKEHVRVSDIQKNPDSMDDVKNNAPIKNPENNEEVSVNSKEEANKVLEDLDSIVDSMGNDLPK